MNRTAVCILASVAVAAGCSGRGASPRMGKAHRSHGAAARTPDAAIAAARRADPDLFAIFPNDLATVRCRIGYGGPVGGAMPGTCTTAHTGRTGRPDYSGQTVIAFTERWQWPPPGENGARHAFSHTWLVALGPTLRVLAVRQRGAVAPQLWH